MENKRLSFLLLTVSSFLLFSCVSTFFKSSEWHEATNLSQIEGTWVSAQGEYSYPFLIDGKKYLRYSWSKSDDTELWKEFAASSKIPLEDLWARRFAFASQIYSSSLSKETIPDSDVNGIETGRKFFLSGERIYSRVEVLIPERLLSINLAFFVLNRDASALKENGSFYLTSEKFPDLTADDTLYFKMKEASE